MGGMKRYALTKDARHGYSVNASKGEVRVATSKDATRDTKRSATGLRSKPNKQVTTNLKPSTYERVKRYSKVRKGRRDDGELNYV